MTLRRNFRITSSNGGQRIGKIGKYIINEKVFFGSGQKTTFPNQSSSGES